MRKGPTPPMRGIQIYPWYTLGPGGIGSCKIIVIHQDFDRVHALVLYRQVWFIQ